MKQGDKVRLKTDGRGDVLVVEDMTTKDGKTLVKISWMGRVLDSAYDAKDFEVIS